MGGDRKRYVNQCIRVTVSNDDSGQAGKASQNVAENTEGVNTRQWWTERLHDVMEAWEIHNDNSILNDAFDWLHNDMVASMTKEQIQTARQQPIFEGFWTYIDSKGE